MEGRPGKTIFTEKETVVSADGEVLSQQVVRHLSVPLKRKFVKMYISCIDDFISLPNSEKNILLLMTKLVKYNSNHFVLTKRNKVILMSELGCSLKTISNGITNLVAKKFLIREGRGSYFINPDCFFKGRESTNNKLYNKLKNKDDNGTTTEITISDGNQSDNQSFNNDVEDS